MSIRKRQSKPDESRDAHRRQFALRRRQRNVDRSRSEDVSNLSYSVSFTRAPRPAEKDGREYFFVDRATFQQMIERGEFLEWADVYGHLTVLIATRLNASALPVTISS